MNPEQNIQSDNEVLVKVEGLSKKFCKDLKTSLWYGVKDLMTGIGGSTNERELRPKEFWAVKDINFELRRGECLGLIGHNGAGKSTLLKILNGLINPDAGKVTIKGRVGALIELGAGFNPILTGRENIYNNGAILGFTRQEIDQKLEAIIAFAELEEFIDMPVQHYSSGMKVRLGFAVAAQMEPDVLIIDEVLAVGDVGFRTKCFTKITELLSNTAVILVSHSMPMIGRYSDTVLLMNKGSVLVNTKNVSDAVEKYYDLFPKREEQNFITNGIILNKLYFNDQSNNIKLKYGNNWNLIFDLRLEKRISFIIRLTILNSEGQVIAVSQSEIFNTEEEGKYKIELKLPDIYLKSGDYNITISFRDFNDLYNISYYQNYCKITVNGGYNDYGAAFLSLPSKSNISKTSF
ncbi:polysaccharide ABC transporter ATP-binding protein [Mesoflavibacter zeaxanthinifaciens]|uniref:ABC transporter ATP-binding protein n=1 Tax=Mesoflavibacter zeaxanthinifaciens TaxID=393060 RepID=UPI003A908EC8